MVERIRRALAGYEPRRLSPQGLVPAAVLIPIYEKDGQAHILFIKRTQEVLHHKGQISFPGGAADAADRDLLATALREAQEEVALAPQHVEVLGQLDDHPTVTSFLVTPFVGLVRPSPYPFDPNRREVAALLEVPLAYFLDGANLTWESRRLPGQEGHPTQSTISWGPQEVTTPAYRWGEEVIWGATAYILYRFLALLAER